MLSLVLALLGLFLATHEVQATCPALSIPDWNAIKDAYTVRNHYEPLRDSCNVSLANNFRDKYMGCTDTLATILINQGLEFNCESFFQSILYDHPKYSDVPAKADKLCNQPFGTTIDKQVCFALSVDGCPRNLDLLRMAVYASCNGGARTASGEILRDVSYEEQRAYYDSGEDRRCMVAEDVCEDFTTLGWETCPLLIHDVFRYIDDTQAVYTCESIYPGAPERCDMIYKDNFELYCPLPTWIQANGLYVGLGAVAMVLLGGAGVFLLIRHRRRNMEHHITRQEVMANAVNQFETFDKPLENVHPELQTVLAMSKFKNVVFDKKTQKWGVLGDDVHVFDSEKAAAQQAYLNLARARGAPGNSYMAPGQSGEYDVEQGEEYTVTGAAPLTEEQTLELRTRQLVNFYHYWEPEKTEPETHARNLLEKHDFDHVVRALKTKYGVCPPQWDTFDEV